MSWKELSHEDGHVLVEYANGQRLNVRYDDIIARSDPDRLPDPPPTGPAVTFVATKYVFKAGQKIGYHEHGPDGVHDIVVVEGQVSVDKEGGSVTLGPGDRATVGIGEMHDVRALTDAVTIHHLLKV